MRGFLVIGGNTMTKAMAILLAILLVMYQVVAFVPRC
jgi:hypothetical protein